LTLKKVVSKKSDKEDGEKQKNKTSKETNSCELNGNHNKTDSINFDVDNTSSLEPNLELDSDTDRNITIDSICTQEDRELENIDVSNENSNEADVKNSENNILEMSIKNSDHVYSPSNSLDDIEFSHDLEDDELKSRNIISPAFYFNISSRAPLHSVNDFDPTLEEDISLPLKETIVIDNSKKRKYEDLLEDNQKSSKVLKLWKIMKYPFQKISMGTLTNENDSTIPKSEVMIKDNKSMISETTVNENNVNEIYKSNGNETETEIGDTTEENTTNKQTFCNIV
jgi:hypothetical protein